MTPIINRRALLRACAATVAVLASGGLASGGLASPTASAAPARASGEGSAGDLDDCTVETLEAFADTLIPGARRHSGDRAVAGVVTGPGAVQAGAVDVLASPELPLCALLPSIAALLNARATAYALLHLILLPIGPPPFVGLSFTHRTALVGELFQEDDLDRDVWVVVSLLVGLAFDTAAHQDTARAVRSGHPGLAFIGFPAPDADGLWRFPEHSYGRQLADLHPRTTASGSPA